MAVTGWNVTYTGAGIVLIYSGFKGTKLSTTVTDLFKGQLDSTDEEPITVPDSGSGASSGGYTGVVPGSDYSVSGAYSTADLEKLWTQNGGPSDTAAFAASVAVSESSGSATVTSGNPDGGTNVGLWQLDTNGVGSGHSVSQLQNADLNAAITVAATKGGIDWTEWGDPVTDALPNHQYSPGS